MEFKISGETKNCDEVIAFKKHALVGVSPFNSRFSESYVYMVVKWANENFEKVDVLVPSVNEAAKLLIAAGRDEAKSIKKTRQEVNRVKRRVDAAIGRLGADIEVIDFDSHKNNQHYVELKDMVFKEVKQNDALEKAFLEMSSQAVQVKASNSGAVDSALNRDKLDYASSYIYAEIPFFLDTPSVLGVEKSTFIYHRSWPIGTELFSGIHSVSVSKNQSFGIVEPI